MYINLEGGGVTNFKTKTKCEHQTPEVVWLWISDLAPMLLSRALNISKIRLITSLQNIPFSRLYTIGVMLYYERSYSIYIIKEFK